MSNDTELYGKDGAEWLSWWDGGRPVHTVEMGGIGPGYEQCIQIMAAEMLRHFLAVKPDHSLWREPEIWKRDKAAMEEAIAPTIKRLGPSGAQFGAACSLSTALYARGPAVVLNEVGRDRRILASKNFPGAKPTGGGA